MTETESPRCSLSETNAHNIVALCSCGWVGAVHTPPRVAVGKGDRFYRDVDRAQRNARDEHKAHARAGVTVDAGE